MKFHDSCIIESAAIQKSSAKHKKWDFIREMKLNCENEQKFFEP